MMMITIPMMIGKRHKNRIGVEGHTGDGDGIGHHAPCKV